MNQTGFPRYVSLQCISVLFMLWAVSDYFGEGKIRKCEISNADAEGKWHN
jgi:hypothetical protein